MFAKDDLIAALRLRYDHYSAQGMYDRARERAGLADKTELDAKDVRALRSAVEASKDRVDAVLARLDEMLGGGGGGGGGGAKSEEPAKAKDGGKDKDKKADKADKADKSDKHEVKADEAKPEPAKAEAKADADKPAEAAADKGGDKPADKPADSAAGAE